MKACSSKLNQVKTILGHVGELKPKKGFYQGWRVRAKYEREISASVDWNSVFKLFFLDQLEDFIADRYSYPQCVRPFSLQILPSLYLESF